MESNKPRSLPLKLSISKDEIQLVKKLLLSFLAILALFLLLSFVISKIRTQGIPNNFSRYIGTKYIIGFPKSWEVQALDQAFHAQSNSLESDLSTIESIDISDSELRNLLASGASELNKDECDKIASGTSTAEAGETLTSRFYKKSGRNACEVTTEGNTNGIARTSRMTVIQYDLNKAYILSASWIKGSVNEENVLRALDTFKILE